MEKNIKDYLHLYLGCGIICDNPDCFSDLEYYGRKSKVSPLLLDKYSNGNWKLLLRPLSDMTEDEMNYCIEVFNLGRGIYDMQPSDWVVGWEAYYPECFLYLLSKCFDLFGLIESGLAIDATKQEVKQ